MKLGPFPYVVLKRRTGKRSYKLDLFSADSYGNLRNVYVCVCAPQQLILSGDEAIAPPGGQEPTTANNQNTNKQGIPEIKTQAPPQAKKKEARK